MPGRILRGTIHQLSLGRDILFLVRAVFPMLYAWVVIKHGSCRLVRVDVMAHPNPDWGLQQMAEVVDAGNARRFLRHDRGSIFAKHRYGWLTALHLTALKLPTRLPWANLICVWVIGTIGLECVNWRIPLAEVHLRAVQKIGVTHYNGRRPHSRLNARACWGRG
jgi:transposase InsO family protein